jgi:glutamine amidotransferase
MIIILNFGLGNILSINNMLKKIGYNSVIANTAEDVKTATKIILPGVGNFDSGMRMLRNAPFFKMFQQIAIDGNIPILGICLGAQMLMEKSEEGNEKGLGLIPGICKRFDKSKMVKELPVPNMGWADVNFVRETPLNKGISEIPRYYFVHSYHICCDNKEDELAVSEYGYIFTAGVNRGNIYGVQFHPEKSHKFGMEILKNFAQF